MNVKRKLLVVLAILLISFPFQQIEAITIDEKTAGTSKEIPEGDFCDNPPADGCSSWSKDFRIKVTLIDKNMNIIKRSDGKSTKTVEFRPYNPYIPGNYGKYYVGKKFEGFGSFTNSRELFIPNEPHDFTVNQAYSVNYSGEANLNYAATNDQLSEWGYWIYMGFGYCETADENCKPVANDFSDYEVNRKKFVDFVKSYERKIHVENDEFNGDVSFIDFFLKVSGYTDVWDYTVNEENLEKLNEYYLEIEPVFTVYVMKNGMKHQYTATAKVLGNLLWQNDYAWLNDGWFGLFNWYKEPRYNYLCSMYDRSDFLNNRWRYSGTKQQREYLKEMEKFCLNPNMSDQLSTRQMSNYLGWQDSPFGLNILKVIDTPTPSTGEIDYNINLNVNSCQNDSFKYEMNLTGKDDKTMFNSIYPNNIEANKLDNYFYHIGENGKELWCYDNILYDFSGLKNIDEDVTAGKVVNLPNGKLTVNRTCYSKSKPENISSYLDQVFGNDPGTYQDTFNFNFGNDTYIYKRNTNKQNEDNTKNYTVSQIDSTSLTQKQYKYTSTFYYDYDVVDAKKNINSINVNNYTLSESLVGTNSIKFNTQFDNAIVVKKQGEINKTYTNTLYATMDNAYGLSSKLYAKLQAKSTGKTTEITGTYNYNSTITLETVKGDTTYKANYKYNEVEKDSCELQTMFSDPGVLGDGDGLKFRVISLSNPFPARDGTSRMAGSNWINKTENNVYDYIQNNRNVQDGQTEKVSPETIYSDKEPMYKITLDATSMIKIREYNKTHSYNDTAVTCENGTGKMCLSDFLKNGNYINSLEGTCSSLNADKLPQITQKNKEIRYYIENNCAVKNQCIEYDKATDTTNLMKNNCANVIKKCSVKDFDTTELDTNNDNKIDANDYLNSNFYTCADKTAKSGG